MRRTVLFFESHSARFDGGQQSLFYLTTNLDRSRFYPIVVGPDEGELTRKLAAAGVEVVVMPPAAPMNRYGGAILRDSAWSKGRLVLPYLRYSGRVVRLIKSRRVDIVHCNSIRSVLMMAPAAHWMRVPLIWHQRLGLELGYWNWIAEKLSARVIVVADSLRREFPAGPGDPAKFITVWNGVDPGPFAQSRDRDQIRATLGLNSHSQVVGMAGSITRRKGQHVFLQAVKEVAERYPLTQFLIIGKANDQTDEAYEAGLRKYVAENGLADRVIFGGWTSDMGRILAAIDLFVLASFNEGLPRVILEAMASSLPVVATNAGGTNELVSDGRTGIMVPPGDSTALAVAIGQVLGDPVKALAMGQAGRRRIEEHFSLRAAACGVEKVIDTLLAGRRPRDGSQAAA